MNEIIGKCLRLPKKERARLAELLKESLNEKANAPKRFRELLIVASNILGKGIDSKCRDTSCVIGRMLITYKMRDEGYSLNQIGIMMGRHHSTILHLERMMEDVFRYPDCFKNELAYWNVFIKALKEDGIY